MINISEADKAIWKSDSVPKNIKIVFPALGITLGNDDVVLESFELSEAINDNRELTFTGCIAANIKFECTTLLVDVRNEYVEVSLAAEGAEEMPLFTGYVDEQKRKNYEDETCTIYAYDRLSQLGDVMVGDWMNTLSYPLSLYDFRTALAQEINLDTEPCELIFDNLQIEKTIDGKNMSALLMIQRICQLNGVFGRISRRGKLEFVSLEEKSGLYPSETLYPGDDLFPFAYQNEISKAYYTDINYEGYNVELIDKVQIQENEDDIGGLYGDGVNAYIVEGNWLSYGRSGEELDAMAQTLYEKVSRYAYMPAEIKCIGLPYMECGDIVEADTAKSHVCTYILSRTIKGIQALSDVYKAEGDKLRSKYVPDVHEDIRQIKSQYNAMSRTVEATYSEVYYNDPETGESKSRIDQNAEAISARVEKTGGSDSFSWELLPDGFVLRTGDKEVFRCDKDGITVSGYATASRIESVEGDISKLYANEATLGNVIATKVTANDVKALELSADKITSGTLSTSRLSSNVITTSNFSSQNINADKITSGTLSANRLSASVISSVLNSPDQGIITVGTVQASNFKWHVGSGTYKSLGVNIKIGTVTYRVLGYVYS